MPTNDEIADRFLAAATATAALIRQRGAQRDWIDEFDGDVILSDDAAFIMGCSESTIRRLCVETRATGKPIGKLVADSLWLISRKRLLAWVRQNQDSHAFLCAQDRSDKQIAGSDAMRSKQAVC
jgi:precorrin-6B methylase 2